MHGSIAVFDAQLYGTLLLEYKTPGIVGTWCGLSTQMLASISGPRSTKHKTLLVLNFRKQNDVKVSSRK